MRLNEFKNIADKLLNDPQYAKYRVWCCSLCRNSMDYTDACQHIEYIHGILPSLYFTRKNLNAVYGKLALPRYE